MPRLPVSFFVTYKAQFGTFVFIASQLAITKRQKMIDYETTEDKMKLHEDGYKRKDIFYLPANQLFALKSISCTLGMLVVEIMFDVNLTGIWKLWQFFCAERCSFDMLKRNAVQPIRYYLLPTGLASSQLCNNSM